MRKATLDLTGQRFGRLVVIERHWRNGAGWKARWICFCDCGGVAVVSTVNLKTGHTKSCGCFRRENSAELMRLNGDSWAGPLSLKTHGKSHTPEYYVWSAMKQRCFNSKSRSYKGYGGRGITVCERWRDSFEAFFADVGKRPSRNHSIDRIDNDGNYEPGNWRWATVSEQNKNKRYLGRR